MVLIGLCGKSNTGKSTFFSAATLVDTEISNRIFTTINPNKGVTYVRKECPCKSMNADCSPRNSKCVDGIRLVPVKITDTAGLVPDAHKGRGLGNQFLSDIMEADALIHVIDISGSSDMDGNPSSENTRRPEEDIASLENEMDYWILGIIKKSLKSRTMLPQKEFADNIVKQLSGLKISENMVKEAVEKTGINNLSSEDEFLKFIKILRKESKPIIMAGNKIDKDSKNYDDIKDIYDIIPCFAEAELALRKMDEKGIIKYIPGSNDFEIIQENEKYKKAFAIIKKVMEKYGSTGVQDVTDRAVFDLLDMIVVYPVENERKLSDKKGNVLPDAFLMKKGSTALDLAYKVHEDIGKKFIAAVDAKTGKNVSSGYKLKDNDIISIRSGR